MQQNRLIQPSTLLTPEQDISKTLVDLVRRIQAQLISLTEANNVLKTQLVDHKIAAEAHHDLELHLQTHIADLSQLNQLLHAQIKEHLRMQVLEQEERTLTNALRDTLATISNTLDLGKVLDHILDNVGRVAPYDGANVLLVESDLVHVVRQRGYIDKALEKESLKQRIPATKLAILQQMIDLGKALAIPDTSTSSMWIGFPDLDWVNSNVIAPIRANGKILGFLSLDSATPGFFTQAHAERLQSFADQAAIAIQSARLLDRAKQGAVKSERNRIANELHDTISQTLWSVILITERLPAIWEINQEQGQSSLAMVHDLAQNALDEMRALLLELRPSALTDESLGDLIRQVAMIIANRAGLQISISVIEQDPVPPEVHFVLYRVVQEAFNNIAHHAVASNITLYFNSSGGQVDISIEDDGMGFDPLGVGPDHLGLTIIKDRIENIGGTVEIISQKGQGTRINVQWIAPPDPTVV